MLVFSEDKIESFNEEMDQLLKIGTFDLKVGKSKKGGCLKTNKQIKRDMEEQEKSQRETKE